MKALVFIGGQSAGIEPGSGVVAGKPQPGVPDGYVRVWFEGNRYGADNLERWADRVHCAADRMISHYPTTAVRDVHFDDLSAIGTYDTEARTFEPGVLRWRSALSKWLGKEIEPADITPTRRRAAD